MPRPSDAESPAPPTRRERRRLEVAQRLLDASESLFVSGGYDETTVADICQAADVAYGTFFNYFPAKSDLLRAMGDRAVAEISEQLDALTKRPLTIEAAMIELFESFAERLESVSPGERALAARVQSLAFTDAPENRDQSFHAAFERFLQAGVEDARVRPDVAVATLADLVSSAYASMALRWVHLEGFPVRARARALARALGPMLLPRVTTGGPRTGRGKGTSGR